MSEKRKFKDIAHITDDRFENIPVSRRDARQGRFTYIADQTEPMPVDDYSIDGVSLLVGSLCNVKTARGNLAARLTEGKVLPGEHYHVARGADDAETRYLYRYLQNVPAQSFATPQAVGDALRLSDLERIPVVWPSVACRNGYTRIMDIIDELDRSTKDAIDALDAFGDALFEKTFAGTNEAKLSDLAQLKPGKDIAARDRNPEGPIPIYSSHGIVSACDTPIAKQACIVVGKAGEHVLLQYVGVPSWPTTGTKYFEKNASIVPLPFLFFALRSIGAQRAIRRGEAARKLVLDELMDCTVTIGDRAKRDEFAAVAGPIIERSQALDEQKTMLSNLRRFYTTRYLAGADDACVAFIDGTEEGAAAGCTCKADASDAAAGTGVCTCESSDADACTCESAADDACACEKVSFTSDASRESGDCSAVVDGILAEFAPKLEADDRLWEFLPLAYLRAKLGTDGFHELASDAQEAGDDKDAVCATIDQRLAQVAESCAIVAFLPNLSYAQSLLDADQLHDLIGKLDGIADADMTAYTLAKAFASLRSKNGSLAAIPPSLRSLLSGLIAVCPVAATSSTVDIYDPSVGCGDMLDIALDACPGTRVTAFAPDFQDELMCRMMLSLQEEDASDDADSDGGASDDAASDAEGSDALAGVTIATCNVLEADPQAGAMTALSVCLIPESGRFWTKQMPSPDDPRWVFGAPAKNREGSALIQQCLAHTVADGSVICLMSNDGLHSSKGNEAEMRAAWAQSGLVSAVIALPGRMVETRAPLSIVIMRGSRSDAGTLFVDAQTCGIEVLGAIPPSRILGNETIRRIVDTFARWTESPATPIDEPGFCAVASLDDIAAADNVLTPWTYVAHPDDATTARIAAGSQAAAVAQSATAADVDARAAVDDVARTWDTYESIEHSCDALLQELSGYLDAMVEACEKYDAPIEDVD